MIKIRERAYFCQPAENEYAQRAYPAKDPPSLAIVGDPTSRFLMTISCRATVLSYDMHTSARVTNDLRRKKHTTFVTMNAGLEAQLKNRKIKPTAMRLLVLDFFHKHQHAISHKDLESGLENTDRITLFRTLKTFEDHRIIHSIDDGSGVVKYAICPDTCECDYPQDIHVHFSCKVCGETQCLPKVKIPPIPLPGDYAPQEANVVVKGICAKCVVA